ncbi:hypothetical protein EVAR_103221_1 [Eumeta japonica]|uniref:Uncharacterized protein n=1 Tax=Eumeta variegata TaxID=151549 RepID=A0A4C1XAF4_EUMVA|nr:hypothetical protein EVAR_103221_1 [Eumeta japonica]
MKPVALYLGNGVEPVIADAVTYVVARMGSLRYALCRRAGLKVRTYEFEIKRLEVCTPKWWDDKKTWRTNKITFNYRARASTPAPAVAGARPPAAEPDLALSLGASADPARRSFKLDDAPNAYYIDDFSLELNK